MQIFLKNESGKNIIIELNATHLTLLPDSGKYIDCENGDATLTVYADEKHRTDPVTSALGLSYFHRFIAVSSYKTELKDNCTIRFYKETAHGNNLESYTRIYPYSTDCSFSAPYYCVKDENLIKEKIARSDKNEAVFLQGAGIAGKLFKAKNTFDDIITAAILGIIALIIFILIWIFKDFRTAAIVYGLIAVFAFLLWKLFLEKTIKKQKQKQKQKPRKR